MFKVTILVAFAVFNFSVLFASSSENTLLGFKESNSKKIKQPLALPRFASLGSDAVNIHVGPGSDYPISWCFKKKNMPVEIVAEYDTWRKIRDPEGAEGWVHKSRLKGKRHVMILKKTQALRSSPHLKASVKARLEPGVVARVNECQGQWCNIIVISDKGRFNGWIKRNSLWGVYANETKL